MGDKEDKEDGCGATGVGRRVWETRRQGRNLKIPMPNAQCPMPNAQCPMPNAQGTPDACARVTRAQHWLPHSRFLIQNPKQDPPRHFVWQGGSHMW
ncbi:MAG: hypothetical protein ACHBN1_16925 [Heteroscytonema crispum UTEX LB 1556]